MKCLHCNQRNMTKPGGLCWDCYYTLRKYRTTPAEETDDLPPVLQFPVVYTVPMKFTDAGEHQPLPFPEEPA